MHFNPETASQQEIDSFLDDWLANKPLEVKPLSLAEPDVEQNSARILYAIGFTPELIEGRALQSILYNADKLKMIRNSQSKCCYALISGYWFPITENDFYQALHTKCFEDDIEARGKEDLIFKRKAS